MLWALLRAGCQAGTGHPLAQSAIFQGISFKSPDLSVEQIVGQFD